MSVLLYANGETLEQVATFCGATPQSISRWVQEAQKGLETLYNDWICDVLADGNALEDFAAYCGATPQSVTRWLQALRAEALEAPKIDWVGEALKQVVDYALHAGRRRMANSEIDWMREILGTDWNVIEQFADAHKVTPEWVGKIILAAERKKVLNTPPIETNMYWMLVQCVLWTRALIEARPSHPQTREQRAAALNQIRAAVDSMLSQFS